MWFTPLLPRRCISIWLALICGLLSASSVGAGEQGATAPKGLEEVVVVFKTHFDIGYTDLASKVIERYRTKMIDDALAVVDQSRSLPPEQQFAWTIPGWPLAKILEDWPGQDAERKRRAQQAFRDGRFVVHALPFSLHTETLEPEDVVRGLSFASQLCRQNGLPLPRDAKMTDVPCHTWLLPTVLTRAGVTFLHLGCNSASSSPEVPPLFWWEGPDGSRLLTMYSAGGYGTGLVPPADWPHKTWLAMIHTGDNHGPPRPAEVTKLLDEAQQKLPGVKVRIGRLSDFGDRILAEKPKLPVIRADMPDTWIHGPMSDPRGAAMARVVRPAMATLEALNTELRAWGIDEPAATEAIAKSYEHSLLYGEHTWGGALYWITPYGNKTNYTCDLAQWQAQREADRFKKLEASWEEHSAYIQKADRLTFFRLFENSEELALAVNTEGGRVVVFNPLPWKRSGQVFVGIRGDTPPNLMLRSIDDLQPVPVKVDGVGLQFLARDVPAMGYRTYTSAPDAPPTNLASVISSSEAIENAFFKVVLNPRQGVIQSLIDKKTGRELVDASAPWGFGQYLYERFDADQVAAFVKSYVKIKADWPVAELGKPGMPPASQVPYKALSPKACKVEISESPIGIEAAMSYAGNAELKHAVKITVILYRDQPHLDLVVRIHDKPADPWPEAGWVCLPLKIAQPQFRLGRPGSIIDPVREVIPGANHHLYSINTGIAVTDVDNHGVGICPLDEFLVSLDHPGCLLYSREFVPQRPYVFVNLFNNLWTTNFRFWNEGRIVARIRMWAYGQYDAETSLIRPAMEARHDIVGGAGNGPAGPLPPVQTGVEVDRGGVFVSALGDNPDGAGTVLRLWELAGRSGDCRVRLPGKLARTVVQPINLRGEPQGAPLVIQNDSFVAPLERFAPYTVLLK